MSSSSGQRIVHVTTAKNGIKYYYDADTKKRVSSASINEDVILVTKKTKDDESCTVGKDGKEYHFKKGKRIRKSESTVECEEGTSCTLGKNGSEYYIDKETKKRVSKEKAKTIGKLPECKPKITCTLGKDGRKYFFVDGVRIKTDEDDIKCSRKGTGKKVGTKTIKKVESKHRKIIKKPRKFSTKVVSVEDISQQDEEIITFVNENPDVTFVDRDEEITIEIPTSRVFDKEESSNEEEPKVSEKYSIPEYTLESEHSLDEIEERLSKQEELVIQEDSIEEPKLISQSLENSVETEEEPILEQSEDEESSEEEPEIRFSPQRKDLIMNWERDQNTGLPIDKNGNFLKHDALLKYLNLSKSEYDYTEAYTLWVTEIFTDEDGEMYQYPVKKIGVLFDRPYLFHKSDVVMNYINPNKDLSEAEIAKKVFETNWIFTRGESTKYTFEIYQTLSNGNFDTSNFLIRETIRDYANNPLTASSSDYTVSSLFVFLKRTEKASDLGYFYPGFIVIDSTDLALDFVLEKPTAHEKIMAIIDDDEKYQSIKRMAWTSKLGMSPDEYKDYMYVTRSASTAQHLYETMNDYTSSESQDFKNQVNKYVDDLISTGYLRTFSDDGIIAGTIKVIGKALSALNPFNWWF